MTALADRPTAAAPPASAGSGTGPRIGRRPSEPQDLPFLRELLAQSRDDVLLLSPDTRDVVLDMRFRAHRRRLRQDHPHARHEVLTVDGAAVGRLVVDAAAAGAGELCIVDLAVCADRRGQGIGTAALASVIAQADAAGRAVRLLAWSGAAGVRRFYLQHGFTTTTIDGQLVHVR